MVVASFYKTEDLEDAKLTEARFLWHSITLSEYWRVKRVPRGLRIHKTPSLGMDDKLFVQQWEQILNKCSMDLMLLVIQKNKAEREKVISNITNLENEIKEKVDMETYNDITTKINATVSEFVKDLQNYKMDKYRRDINDYEVGTIYDWHGKRKPFKTKQQRPAKNIKDPLSTASERESSDDGASDVAVDVHKRSSKPPFQPARPQKGKRGGARAAGGEPPPRRSPRNKRQ